MIQLGYDSTWSEVEQILDNQNPELEDLSKVNLYKKIKNNFGVIGVLIIHNMMNDPKIEEKLIVEGKEMRSSLNSFTEESIRYAFYLLLHNIIISFRVLRYKKDANKLQFWM